MRGASHRGCFPNQLIRNIQKFAVDSRRFCFSSFPRTRRLSVLFCLLKIRALDCVYIVSRAQCARQVHQAAGYMWTELAQTGSMFRAHVWKDFGYPRRVCIVRRDNLDQRSYGIGKKFGVLSLSFIPIITIYARQTGSFFTKLVQRLPKVEYAHASDLRMYAEVISNLAHRRAPNLGRITLAGASKGGRRIVSGGRRVFGNFA